MCPWPAPCKKLMAGAKLGSPANNSLENKDKTTKLDEQYFFVSGVTSYRNHLFKALEFFNEP